MTNGKAVCANSFFEVGAKCARKNFNDACATLRTAELRDASMRKSAPRRRIASTSSRASRQTAHAVAKATSIAMSASLLAAASEMACEIMRKSSPAHAVVRTSQTSASKKKRSPSPTRSCDSDCAASATSSTAATDAGSASRNRRAARCTAPCFLPAVAASCDARWSSRERSSPDVTSMSRPMNQRGLAGGRLFFSEGTTRREIA